MGTFQQEPETDKRIANSTMVQQITDLVDSQSRKDFLELYNSLFPAANLTLDDVDWEC